LLSALCDLSAGFLRDRGPACVERSRPPSSRSIRQLHGESDMSKEIMGGYHGRIGRLLPLAGMSECNVVDSAWCAACADLGLFGYLASRTRRTKL
jgi:hypothetical protein